MFDAVKKFTDKHQKNGAVKYVKTNLGILSAFFIMFLFLSLATQRFLTADNWINIFRQVTTNTTISIGLMMAIIISGIDLTVGSIIALSGCVTVKAIVALGIPVFWAVILGCFVGALSGLITGCIIAYTDMPPFVVTLAMMNVGRGAAYLVANGSPIRLSTEEFEQIGSGYLGFIPLPVVYTGCLLLLTWFILNRTILREYRFLYIHTVDAWRHLQESCWLPVWHLDSRL